MREIGSIRGQGRAAFRAWLSSDGAVRYLQPGEAHSTSVIEQPEVFGMSAQQAERLRADSDNDGAIFSALRRGWIRLADDWKDAPSVHAVDERRVARGVQWMIDNGHVADAVRVEIQRQPGDYGSRLLHGKQIDQFLRNPRA